MRYDAIAYLALVGGVTYFVYKTLFEEKGSPSGKSQTKMGCMDSKPDDAPPEAKKSKVDASAPPAVNNTTSQSSAAAAKTTADSTKKASGGQEYSWNKKKLDPKDFMFSNLKGQVCIKEPGAINGQAFIIEDCEDCDIYLCDVTAQVQVDYCKNCRIFIGPVESSIFIRNCENCKCIFACQQLRTRDCVNCDTLLFVSTAPVVETSKNMRFGCFRFFYFSLAAQFEQAKLSVYDNKWSEIYDFTPADGNWSFLPINAKVSDIMKPLGDIADSFVAKDEQEQYSEDSVVPVTVGVRKGDYAGQERAFVLILPAGTGSGPMLLSKIPEGCVFIQTKQMQLDAAKVKTLFAESGAPSSLTSAAKGMCVGVEVVGAGALAGARAAVEATGGNNVAYSSASDKAAQYEVNVFFEQMLDTTFILIYSLVVGQWRDFAGTAVTK